MISIITRLRAAAQKSPDRDLMFEAANLIYSLRAAAIAQSDSELMKELQLYKARWLECVTPEEAQRLRDEIERLRQFEPSPAEQAQMKLNKEARDRRKAAGYDGDDWRKPGE